MKLSKQTVFDLFVFYNRHRNQIKDVNMFLKKFVEINTLLKKNKEADHKVGDKKMTYAALLRGRETPKCQKRYELLVNSLVKSKVMTGENVTAVTVVNVTVQDVHCCTAAHRTAPHCSASSTVSVRCCSSC
jgi:hypothetical protein